MSNIDFREVKNSVDLVALVESYGVRMRRDGGEFVGLCPFHNEATPSFHVNPRKGLYRCWGCGEAGSGIDFTIKAEALRGTTLTATEAAEKLLGKQTGGALPTYTPTAKAEPWEPVIPIPDDVAGTPDLRHYQMGLAAAHWPYYTAEGALVGFVARFNLADGSKDLRPLVYAERNGKRAWKFQGFPKPRPFYNLRELVARPDVPVCIVEGEKAADAARELLPGSVVLAWAGGSNSMKYVDWAALAGRRVLLWPDADAPGFAAMFGRLDERGDLEKGAAQYAAEAGATCMAVLVPDDKPQGWDAADALALGWQRDDATMFLQANVKPLPAPAVYVPATHKSKKAPAVAAPPKLAAGAEDDDSEDDVADLTTPFRALGYAKNAQGQNEFWFYSHKARQALRFTPASFSVNMLVQLANVEYWERTTKAKRGDWLSPATQSLINMCYDAGVYDPDKVRGIGAWLDGSRVVVHAGTHLVVDNHEHGLAAFPTSYIYEATKAFGFNKAEPLNPKEAARFYELAALMNWERPLYADLFLGWCVIAPVCGALTWRPHIWITGGAGTGKSTTLTVMREMVGAIGLPVQGSTTEPAIRQMLQSNARPVLFDEADSDSRADTERFQAVLSLARASSSHDGGAVAKGTAGGGTGHAYLVRSCFAFASITPKVATTADRSRISILSLIKRSEPQAAEAARWEKIQSLMADVLTPENCARLQARTLSLLPQILANARVFTRAAATVLGQQRAGDQLGVMLAGAYSLKRGDLQTYEGALAWLQAPERDFSEIRSEEKDEETLLGTILEQRLRVESGNGVAHERAVGTLVDIVANPPRVGSDEVVDSKSAAVLLRDLGIKVDTEAGVFYVANRSQWIKRILANTNWANNHNKVLTRLEGAKSTEKGIRFTPAIFSRATAIPLALLGGAV